MSLELERMLMEKEKGLVIDFNTIWLDSINQAIEIAIKDSEAMNHFTHKEYIVAPLVPLIHLACFPTRDLLKEMYGDVAKYVEVYRDKKTKHYINPFNIRHKYPITDFGDYLIRNAEDKGTNIKWTIMKSEDNDYILPGYEDNTITTNIMDFKAICKYIDDNDISVIYISEPYFVLYMMNETELCDRTILYTNWANNQATDKDSGMIHFIYAKQLTREHELDRRLELISVDPYENLCAQIIKDMEEEQQEEEDGREDYGSDDAVDSDQQ